MLSEGIRVRACSDRKQLCKLGKKNISREYVKNDFVKNFVENFFFKIHKVRKR